MTDDSQPNSSIPPKLDLRQSGIIGQGDTVPTGTRKKTARINVDEIVPAALPAEPKKQTSRISLEMVSGAEAGAPKTVRLKPVLPVNGDLRRQTSRIPLEQALAQDGQAEMETAPAKDGGQPIPKTIRIKRPASAVSVDSSLAGAEPVPVADEAVPSKSKTSRIDVSQVAEAVSQATQRKTIKIRRAEGSGGAPRRVTPIQSGGVTLGVAPALESETVSAGGVAEDQPGVVFVAIAAAAVVVSLVVLGVLAVEAFPSLGAG